MASEPAPQFRTHVFSADETHFIPYLAALHAQCITKDGTIATFLTPLNNEKLLAWWKDRIAEVAAGTRLMVLLLNQAEPRTESLGLQLAGVATLFMPYSETGSMRGFVEKVLVNPKYRRMGGASLMMARLEQEAVNLGRDLLMIDAETGSNGAKLYEKLGYTELGVIPRYAKSPRGGLRDEVFFYKHL